MNEIKFSIITPVYKRDLPMLNRAIASVQAQTYSNWELWVVDDNKRDSIDKQQTVELEKDYAEYSNIMFAIQDDNYGANHARNVGVEKSRGSWIAFLDSDDAWEPGYLSSLVEIIQEKPRVDLISTARKDVTEGGTTIAYMPELNGNIFLKEVVADRLSPTTGIAARKEAIIKAGLFDEKLPARQDYDMWLRITEFASVEMNNIPLVTVYRDGHEAISSNYRRHVQGTLLVMKKIGHMNLPHQIKKEALRTHYLYLAKICIFNHDWVQARSLWFKSLGYGMTKQSFILGFYSCLPAMSTACKKIVHKFKSSRKL